MQTGRKFWSSTCNGRPVQSSRSIFAQQTRSKAGRWILGQIAKGECCSTSFIPHPLNLKECLLMRQGRSCLVSVPSHKEVLIGESRNLMPCMIFKPQRASGNKCSSCWYKANVNREPSVMVMLIEIFFPSFLLNAFYTTAGIPFGISKPISLIEKFPLKLPPAYQGSTVHIIAWT